MVKLNQSQQELIVIMSFACRLFEDNSSSQKLWDFLEQEDVASSAMSKTRFNFEDHYDEFHKSKTMCQSDEMFLENVDLIDFDAEFFEIDEDETAAMNSNQRQMLEVVFEDLENAGISLKKLNNRSVSCFVESYSSDYADMQARDPHDHSSNNAIEIEWIILVNRLSHFLNIKRSSVTLDTTCSGSLQILDFASRYLQSRDVDAAIIVASNLYMSSEHVIDQSSLSSAHSMSLKFSSNVFLFLDYVRRKKCS